MLAAANLFLSINRDIRISLVSVLIGSTAVLPWIEEIYLHD
jgi:hypothetical protein